MRVCLFSAGSLHVLVRRFFGPPFPGVSFVCLYLSSFVCVYVSSFVCVHVSSFVCVYAQEMKSSSLELWGGYD